MDNMAVEHFPNLFTDIISAGQAIYVPSDDCQDAGKETLSQLVKFKPCDPRKKPYILKVNLKCLLVCPFIFIKLVGTLPNYFCLLFLAFVKKFSSRKPNVYNMDPLSINNERDLFDIIVQEEFTEIWQGEVSVHDEQEYVHRLTDLLKMTNMKGYPILMREFHEICMSDYANRQRLWMNTVPDKNCKLTTNAMVTIVTSCLLQGFHSIVIPSVRRIFQSLDSFCSSEEIITRGVHLLHLGIVNTDCELLDLVLNNIKPEDKYGLLHQPSLSTAKIGGKHAAALPLTMAVWMGNTVAVRRLVEAGAEMSTKDANGFTVFHFLAILEQHVPEIVESMYEELIDCIQIWIKMTKKYSFLRSNDEKQALLYAKWLLIREKSDEGYTALQLAAKFGSVKTFTKLVNTDYVYSFPYFSFGPFSKNLYDVSDIDPFLNWNRWSVSVLEIIGLGPTDKNIECLNIEPVASLIEEKWEKHRPTIVFWGIIHITFMIVYSYLGFIDLYPHLGTNRQVNATLDRFEFQPVDYLLLIMTVWYFILSSLCLSALISCSFRLHFTLNQWISSLGIMRVDCMLFFTASSALYLLLKYLENDTCVVFLSVSILVGWFLLLLYMRASKQLNFFNVMLSHIIRGDAIQFSCIIVLISVAFSVGSAPIFETYEYSDGKTFFWTFMNFLRLGLGVTDFSKLYDKGIKRDGNDSIVVIYAAFIFAANLVLLNMLIASMTDAYSKLAGRRHLLCSSLTASDCVLLESILPLPILNLTNCVRLHKVIRIHLPHGKTADRHVYLFPACTSNN